MKAEIFNILIKRVKISRNAFNKIYSFYFPKIVIHLSIKFGNYELGRDVAQDFFVKLYQINQREYVKYPTSWIFTIVDNLAKNILTKESKYKIHPLSEEEFKISDVYFFDNFGDYFHKLNRLEVEERKIVVMRVLEGYSFCEISKILGIK